MTHLIDTHMHLDGCKNHKEIYEKINKLKQYTLCVTNTPQDFERCIKTYPETKYLKFALGFNPQYAGEKKFNSFIFMRNIKKTKYIGEVGLDFTKPFVKYKDEQIKIFDFICKIAANNNHIMSIHSRGAEKEVLEILIKNNVKRAILHWYTGDVGLIDRFIEEGYYFSINDRMGKGEKGKEIINRIPKDRKLIETDYPYNNSEDYFAELIMWSKKLEKISKIKIDYIKNFKELLIVNLKND
ncbi:MAG TPA: TatD family deoxyribonuclease [Epulopiscium sp.]|nr:TatD family deoxyribonuclease [Candidatus Epulonipiscium sp.]